MNYSEVNQNYLDRRSRPYIFLFLLINLLGFIYYLHYYIQNFYLPSPFFYDKSDTFMDLFNPLFWAYDKGRFTEWGSVYPPLNFLILKALNFLFHGSLQGNSVYLRDNSKLLIYGFLLLYFLVPALILKSRLWEKFHLYEKIIIYFFIVLSTPMLFALERGNLIFLTLIFLCLAVSRSGFIRALSIAILINIKPYFFILIIIYIVGRNWRSFIVCCALAGIIFILTGLVLGGDFLVFFYNIFIYSQDIRQHSLREIMVFPSSISAFSYVISSPSGLQASSLHLNAEDAEYLVGFIGALKYFVLTASLIVLFKKSQCIKDNQTLSLLVVVITNLGIWVGGYTLILYFVLIPVFLNMRYRWIYLSFLIILFAPLDFFSFKESNLGYQYSYLSHSIVNVNWSLGLGSVIRPCINFLLLIVITYEFHKRKISS